MRKKAIGASREYLNAIQLKLVARDKWSSLLVVQEGDGATAGEQGHERLENREEREDGKGEGRPMDKGRVSLVREDGKERPSDDSGTGKITFGRGEGVGSGRGLEEQEAEENKDFGPNAGLDVTSINAKGLECSQDNEDGGPAMV
jgi:hypothetical protein